MRTVAALGLVVMAVVLWPARADAYLNPDSGSLLLQVLLGGGAGLAVAVRLFWRRFAARFTHRSPPAPGSEP